MSDNVPAELANYIAFWLSDEGFTVNQAVMALERAYGLLSGCTFDARSFVSDTTKRHFAFLSNHAHLGEQSSPKFSSGLSGSNLGGKSLAQLPAFNKGQKTPKSPIVAKDTPMEEARSIIDTAGREIALFLTLDEYRVSTGEAADIIASVKSIVLKSPLARPVWAREKGGCPA